MLSSLPHVYSATGETETYPAKVSVFHVIKKENPRKMAEALEGPAGDVQEVIAPHP